MATLSSLMIALGINLTGLNQGLNQAKGNLKNFSGEVGNMSRSFANAATANYLLVQGLYQLQAAVRTSFAAGLKAADDYRLGVLNVASTLTDMTEEGADKQQAFNNLLIYSQEMYKALELEAVRHFASGKELQLAWTLLAQKGVALRFEEVAALGIIVDKIKLITQGQASTVQISQELRSMLNGQARSTDQLAILLEGKYGLAWKKIVNEQRQSGTLIEWLAKEFVGLAIAIGHVTDTIESQATTLWTMIRRVGREGLGGAYDYIVSVMKVINRYLIEHEQTISRGILSAWGAVQPLISEIGVVVRDIIGYIWNSGSAFITLIGYVTAFVQTVISAGRAFIGFAEGYGWIVQIIAGLLAAKLALGLIVALLSPILSLGTAIYTALAALGGFIATSLGLAGIAGSFTGIGLAVVAVGIAIAAATSLIEAFGISAANAINKAKASASFATGITPEEYQKRMAVESYRSRVPSWQGIVEEGVKEVVPGSSIGHGEGPSYRPRGSSVLVGTEDYNRAIASGRPFLAYDEKGVPRLMNAPDMTSKESLELGKLALEKQEIMPGAIRGDEDKKGKGPEKLLGKEWELIKAQRDKELAGWKNYLSNLEKVFELEKDKLDVRLAQGEISGSDYLSQVVEQTERVYQVRVLAIAKEKEIEDEAYEERKKQIAKEAVRDALSPEKVRIENAIAYEQYLKRIDALDKQNFENTVERSKRLLEVTKEAINARKELLGIAVDLMGKFAWGPIAEREFALLKNTQEFAEISKKFREAKIGFEGGELTIDPAFLTMVKELEAFGKLLNTDWSKPFSEAVNRLITASTQGEARRAIDDMSKSLPGMKEDMAFQIKWRKTIDGITSAISSGMADIAMEIMTGGKKVKDVMVSMVKNIFQAILKPQFEILGDLIMRLLSAMFKKIYASIVTDKIMGDLASSVLGFFGGLFGGGDVTGFSTGPGSGMWLAHGGVLNKGVLQPFVRGGIVNKPTLFPMANGMGLMGEAGTEAIMPLTRIGGDLGVKAMFGEKSEPKITVINNLGVEATPKTSGSQEDLVIQLDKANAQNLSRGGRQTKVLEKMYGLRPVTTRR